MNHRVNAAALGCLLGIACGGDEPSSGTGAGDSNGAQSAATHHPPVIEEVSLEPGEPRPGQRVSARVTAHDPDGDRITLDYHWRVSGIPVQEADGSPSLHVEGNEPGTTIEVTVVARDAYGASNPEIALVRVANLPPTIVQVVMKPLGEVSAGNDVTASPMATDPEGDAIEYRYQWSVNDETVPNDGPTLPAKLLKRGDRIALEVVASDGRDESEPLKSPPIEVVNAAPRIVSNPGTIGADGIFRYAVQAEDADGDRVFRYRLAKGPEGMTIGFDDGRVHWDPPVDAAGSHDVEIEVEDRFGASSKQQFPLQLSYEAEQPPLAAKEESPAAASATE